jgi:hypothetical protein
LYKKAMAAQNVNMKKIQKRLQQIRGAEAALAYATPKQAARLVSRIVKWKAQLFSDES